MPSLPQLVPYLTGARRVHDMPVPAAVSEPITPSHILGQQEPGLGGPVSFETTVTKSMALAALHDQVHNLASRQSRTLLETRLAGAFQ